MAIPWLKLIDVAFGLNDVVRRARSGTTTSRAAGQLAAGLQARPMRDSRLAGVMMGALREVFDRDRQRQEFELQRAEEERLRLEEERQRAERLLRLDLLRQAGERETNRARTVLAAATASLLGTMLIIVRLTAGTGARVTLGLGWVLLLGAIALSFHDTTRVARLLSLGDDRLAPERITGGNGAIAVGLLLAGLALVGLAVLVA